MNLDINSILVGGALIVGGVAIGSTFAQKKAADFGHKVAKVIPGNIIEPRIADIAIAFANAVNDDSQPEIKGTLASFNKFAEKHVDISKEGKLQIK